MNRYKIVALIWTWTAIGLSAIPSKSIPRTFLDEIFGIDKIAHILFYLLMTLLWSLSLRGCCNMLKVVLIAILFSSSIGLALEVFQKVYFVDRSFDWYDSIANIFGAMCGGYLFLKYEKFFPIFA